MRYIADLHVHSKYSIATAKNLDLENLYIAAQKKGITVVGTGDFTHPHWMEELKEKLIPAEPGLYRLKKDIEKACIEHVPAGCRKEVRFILTTEISNIYKKGEKTRKNHNLVLAPDLQVAQSINAALDKIGNIKSDGRPILGLDARNLLEIVLKVSEINMLIPAHIWTPWFSLLGSKSGFDSVEACFKDLTPYIFAVETGLSSDPAMNWRVSDLDRMTLVSNSDAHSPMKLGREANLFDTDLSYEAIRKALIEDDPYAFQGTLEFFPEEGKYHLDGHKKCNVRLTPDQTLEKKGICPVCEKPLTVGVLYRVETLADKKIGRKAPRGRPYQHVVSLAEMLSQILGVGCQSKKVQNAYEMTLDTLGDEFSILLDHPLETIEKKSTIPLLGEAIRRMREGQIEIKGGFDGEFGTIRLFKESEKRQLLGQRSLFSSQDSKKVDGRNKLIDRSAVKSKPIRETKVKLSKQTTAIKNKGKNVRIKGTETEIEREKEKDLFSFFNPAQKEAVYHDNAPLIIAAGPGTGKTMTITGRMVHLIKEKKVPPQRILAVTFTNKAAEEMKIRLKRYLPQLEKHPLVATFHAFCMALLQKSCPQNPPMILDETDQEAVMGDAISQVKNLLKKKVNKTENTISLSKAAISQIIMAAKQKHQPLETITTGKGDQIDNEVRAAAIGYQNLLNLLGVCDYEDLIIEAVKLLKVESGDGGLEKGISDQLRYNYIFIDEYQDINEGQYRLLRTLVSPEGTGLCVIGDPHQAIYGFRGSDARFFYRFLKDFKKARRIDLTQNYRSTQTIVNAAVQMISLEPLNKKETGKRLYSRIEKGGPIRLITTRSAKEEAAAIGRRIVQLIGGRGYHDVDLKRADKIPESMALGFDDIAVVYRTGRQGEILSEVLQKTGIPVQRVVRRRQSQHQKIRQLISLLTILEGRPLYKDIENIRGLFDKAPTKKTITVFTQWGLLQQLNPRDALDRARLILIKPLSRSQQICLEGMVRQIRTWKEEVKTLSLMEKIEVLAETLAIEAAFEKEPELEIEMKNMIVGAAGCRGNSSRWLSNLAMETDTDTYLKQSQQVALLTMHAAKGLEFPVVFIAGCEDGLIPFRRTGDKKDSQPVSQHDNREEEQRLFYVAMTRAKKKLYLTWAKRRQVYGKRRERIVSPFIETIDPGLIEEEEAKGRKDKPKPIQQSLF